MLASAGALGPPGLELLKEAVEIIPAKQALSLVTTERELHAGTAVALRVTRYNMAVCVRLRREQLRCIARSMKLMLGVVAGSVGVMTAEGAPPFANGKELSLMRATCKT